MRGIFSSRNCILIDSVSTELRVIRKNENKLGLTGRAYGSKLEIPEFKNEIFLVIQKAGRYCRDLSLAINLKVGGLLPSKTLKAFFFS
jgi:hypothetical protein